jgi:diphosphomevalonate decarboxylase
MDSTAFAAAHPNIALIKYWGNRDEALRLPHNSSISMTLAGLHTVTRVRFHDGFASDVVVLHGRPATGEARLRVTQHLDLVRRLAGLSARAEVVSANDFPTAAGLASSASAFAALTVAATRAAGLDLSATELSRLARRGSGSACRSILGGFVEWEAGQDDQTSYAVPLAAADHWPLMDIVAVISTAEKGVGSSEGHRLSASSPAQAARLASVADRLAVCRAALRRRDFPALANVVEQDSDLMHAVMESSTPPLRYRLPASLALMSAVQGWRAAGLAVCYTLDAGPNVHCLCPAAHAPAVEQRLEQVPDVLRVITAAVGSGARSLLESDPLTALL